MATQKVQKLLVVPGVVALEYAMYGKKISPAKSGCLLAMMAGISLATVTDVSFALYGTTVALSWTVVAVGYKVGVRVVEKKASPSMPRLVRCHYRGCGLLKQVLRSTSGSKFTSILVPSVERGAAMLRAG